MKKSLGSSKTKKEIQKLIVDVVVDSFLLRNSNYSKRVITEWYMKKIANIKGRAEIRRILSHYLKTAKTSIERTSCNNALLLLNLID